MEPPTKLVEDPPFDFTVAIAHRDAVIEYLMSFKGELEMNPWIVIRRDIDPLNRRLADGELSRNLYDSLMALKKTPPYVR